MNANPNKWYPYTISLKAYAEGGFFSPSASAHAEAADPQYFMGNSSSGLSMTNTITLQAGSSVYESAAGASASSYFDQTTDLLSSPILSIAITGSPTGLVTADVWFNPDPSLSFGMSASALASLIESSGMGTMSGTSSDISLSYTLDLPSTGVSSSDWIGADAVNNASVPEPGSMTLMVIGLCGALGYLRFGSIRRSPRIVATCGAVRFVSGSSSNLSKKPTSTQIRIETQWPLDRADACCYEDDHR